MRNKIKKPLTARARKQIITQLRKLSNDTAEQVQIVDQSITHDWQGLYALKGEKSSSGNPFLDMLRNGVFDENGDFKNDD